MTDVEGRPVGLPEETRTGSGWGSVLARLLVAVVVLGAAYTLVALYFKDRPPAGLSVAGVDVGGLTREDAAAEIARELSGRLEDPLTVLVVPEPVEGGSAEPDRLELVPEEAGLALDLEATLDGVTRLSFDPRVLWSHVAGTPRELPVVGSVDRALLEQAVAGLADDYDTRPVEGEVGLTDEGVEVVDSLPGRLLDVPTTVEEVATAWADQVWDEQDPAPREREVTGAATGVPPLLTPEEIERFTSEELGPALAEPVRVTATRGEGEEEQSATAELVERDLRQLLDVEVDADHTLSLSLDEDGLVRRVRQDLGRLEAGPRDATVRLAGEEVEVVPSRVGHAVQTDGLAEQVRAALGAEGEGRTVSLEVATVDPQIPTSVAQGWSFAPMATFSSEFPTYPGNEARTANLTAGAANIDGTVVMPGEQFSLGTALGEISEESGYVEAPVIIDGRLVQGLGGGLSQISTVVFNTAWFSGVQLDAHTPHSFYIPRYPAGREATLAVPVIDNLWTNDTDTPVVVRSWIEGDTVSATFLGDRQYDVQTFDGERRDVTTSESAEDDSPDCVPQSPQDGFTITNVRILLQGGVEVGRDEFTTTYKPSDEITCTHPDAQGR